MDIAGNKGLFQKLMAADADWTKNRIHRFILVVLVTYFGVKLLYSAVYGDYSYQSMKH